MYHFIESGLPNIWLRNGYTEENSPYGPTVAFEDIFGLHRAIAHALIERNGILAGEEIRFLRQHMELSQESLGNLIGIGVQSVALWEKNRSRITATAEKLLRLIVRGHLSGNATIRRAIDALNHLDATAHADKLVFETQGGGWHVA